MPKLPNEIVPASSVNPNKLILFSKPKAGKTTVLSMLPQCLLIDLEQGAKYVDAYKVEANNLEDLLDIATQLTERKKETGVNPFKFIALDTISALEDMVLPLAAQIYRDTPQGKNWGKDPKGNIDMSLDIRDLPNGAGYRFVRDAFFKVVNRFESLCDHLILSAHLKETLLQKNGEEFTSMEIDLIGKLKTMTSSRADAIGYLYRKNNETRVSFVTSEQVVCGSRSKHTKNTDIVLAESDKDGNITNVYWNKIFI